MLQGFEVSCRFLEKFHMYCFYARLVSLLFDAIERGFKADLIKSRIRPDAVPGVTLNVERMNYVKAA